MPALPDFRLEAYFSRWEFAARHHLTASDAQTLTLAELLDLADDDSRRRWEASSGEPRGVSAGRGACPTVRSVSRGQGRRYRRAAPVPLLVVLVVLVVVVAFLFMNYRSTHAGAPAGSGGGSAAGARAAARGCGRGGGRGPPGRAGGAGALAVGPGPQQRYTVHEDAPAGACPTTATSRGKPLPDPTCTPGAVSPAVTQATIARTICASGYTRSVRPPRDVTDREKRLSSQAYGYGGPFGTSEYDHLVPLGLGGDPNDARNLWLEPNEDARATTNTNGKDAVEATLHAAVCDRRVALADAQRVIAADWVTALADLGLR